MELNAAFGPLCAAAHGDPAQPYPTFSLALAALSEPALERDSRRGPLRRWNLIEVAAPQTTLTTARLRLDERILHFLQACSSWTIRRFDGSRSRSRSGIVSTTSSVRDPCPEGTHAPSHRAEKGLA